MGAHLNEAGKFQSDKYPTTPAGKVPLSVEDPTAQDLLWEYAQRRRSVDAEFSDDLETALREAGYAGSRDDGDDGDDVDDGDADRASGPPMSGRMTVAIMLVATGEFIVTQLGDLLPAGGVLFHVLLCASLFSLGCLLGRPLDR
jgi:hypothetical protein